MEILITVAVAIVAVALMHLAGVIVWRSVRWLLRVRKERFSKRYVDYVKSVEVAYDKCYQRYISAYYETEGRIGNRLYDEMRYLAERLESHLYDFDQKGRRLLPDDQKVILRVRPKWRDMRAILVDLLEQYESH